MDWVYVVPAGAPSAGEPVLVADHVEPHIKLSWSGDVLTIAARRARVFKAGPSTTIRTAMGLTSVAINVTVAEPVV